jgi:hypothetical protein
VVWQTAALVAISVFGAVLGAFYQCLLLIAALMLASYMQTRFEPHVHVQAGKAMLQGTHCLLLTTVNRTICQRVIWKVPLKVMLADFGCPERSCWHNLEDQLLHELWDENSESTTVFLSSSTFQRYTYFMLA